MLHDSSETRGPENDEELFVALVAEHQSRLQAYIFSLLADRNRAADVLQETNLVLWRKKSEYRSDSPFIPWAFSIARFQVLAHLRDSKKEPGLVDPELAEALAAPSELLAERFEEMQTAVRHCVEALPEQARKLVASRYFQSKSVAKVAESESMGESAVKVALLRARRQLAKCVSGKLGMRWSP